MSHGKRNLFKGLKGSLCLVVPPLQAEWTLSLTNTDRGRKNLSNNEQKPKAMQFSLPSSPVHETHFRIDTAVNLTAGREKIIQGERVSTTREKKDPRRDGQKIRSLCAYLVCSLLVSHFLEVNMDRHAGLRISQLSTLADKSSIMICATRGLQI